MDNVTTSTDRRAVLRSILAAGAVAASPAGVVASVPVPTAEAAVPADADLFALIDRLKDLDRASDAAWDALDEAEARVEEPAPPAALFVREDDASLWPFGPSGQAGALIMVDEIEQLRIACADLPAGRPILDAARARADELAAAQAVHKAARDDAAARAGVPAAEIRAEEASTEWRKGAREVAKARAKTVDGIMAKLRFLAPYFDRKESNEEATADDILCSVVVDARALYGAPLYLVPADREDVR